MNHKSWVDSVEGREEKMKKGGHPGAFNIDNTSSNNNKRKIHDEILEEGLPVPKHACLGNKDHRPLFQIQDPNTTCIMSLSYDSKHDHDVSSSSSVNWSGATTLPDSIHHFDYSSPSFDQESQLDCMMCIPEYYKTIHQSQDHGDGDGDGGLMFCSNADEEASSTNYVLSQEDGISSTTKILNKLVRS